MFSINLTWGKRKKGNSPDAISLSISLNKKFNWQLCMRFLNSMSILLVGLTAVTARVIGGANSMAMQNAGARLIIPFLNVDCKLWLNPTL